MSIFQRLTLPCTTLLACLLSCSRSAGEQKTLYVNDRIMLEAATVACTQRNGCSINPETAVRMTTLELDTAFSKDASCHGISMSHARQSPTERDLALQENASYALLINLDPDSDQQSWKLNPRKDERIYGGIDRPSTIMHSVCMTINEKGGSINN